MTGLPAICPPRELFLARRGGAAQVERVYVRRVARDRVSLEPERTTFLSATLRAFTMRRSAAGRGNDSDMKTYGQDAKTSSILVELLVMMAIVAGLGGCDDRPATARVRGRVMFKDGSVPQSEVCVVRFEPTADSAAPIRKAASGEIERNGSFEMYTRKPGDGVFLGNYAVTFSVWKDRDTPESLIAEKYTKSDTTPYKIQVERDVDDLVYEIEPIEPSGNEPVEPPDGEGPGKLGE